MKHELDSLILFKTIVGSQAYGTHLPTSDIDEKFVFAQHPTKLLGFGYQEQLNINKDNTGYEVKRMLELLSSANPTLLELLSSPPDCILEKHPAFDLILNRRQAFLTKNCRNSFGGYAIQQIKKAKGTDKKMNWESKRVERKTPVDFCYIYEKGHTILLSEYLTKNKMEARYCGLSKLNHIRDGYALYYDYSAHYGGELNSLQSSEMGYRGICSEEGNDVHVSEIPKDVAAIAFLYFNKDAYSTHCKDYNEYKSWLENRNTQRYVDNRGHNQKIDGKNMMHCRRLLDMAIEIARYGEVIVRRPNRDELLAIRRGEVNLHELIEKGEEDILLLDELYASSNLPEAVDAEMVNELLLEIRATIRF